MNPQNKPNTTQKTIGFKDPLEVKIKLTPEQLWQAYQKLLELQNIEELKGHDWMDEPEMKEMIREEAKKAKKEYEQGQYVTLEQLQKEF